MIRLFKSLTRAFCSASIHSIPGRHSGQLIVPKTSYPNFLFENHSPYANNVTLVNGITGEYFRLSEVVDLIGRVSSGLYKLGVRQSTVVGIVAPNSPENGILQQSIIATGAAVTLCNNLLSESEFRHHFSKCRPKFVFTVKELADKVAASVKELQCCEAIYLMDCAHSSGSYKSLEELMNDKGDESCLFRKDIITSPRTHVAQLLPSSGTTGLPKIVQLSHENLITNLIQLEMVMRFEKEKEVLIGVMPMFHVYGMVLLAFTFHQRCKLIVLPKFDPTTFLQALEKHKVTILHIVPPLVLFLLHHPHVSNYDLSPIQQAVCGAAALTREVEETFVKKFQTKCPTFHMNQVYGMTEASPVTHYSPRVEHRKHEKFGSIGFTMPGMECKLMDPETNQEITTPNTSGEAWVRGPNVMMGYLGNPDATEACLTPDGWLRTGDMLHYDEDGYYFFSDRLKELIKYKGLQVAPAELEGVLLNHPGIADAAVIGKPDDHCGELPMAFVVRKSDKLTEEEVQQFVADHLASFKQLRGGVKFINAIPKSPSGKILRKLLKIEN